MSTSHPPQTLVHLPRIQPSSPDPQLPRGSCRYVYPADSAGPRPPCPCMSFVLDRAVPGAKCGCGHQAWVHETNPSGNAVAAEDYAAMVEKVDQLTHQLQEEQKKSLDAVEKIHKQVIGQYKNMTQLKFYVDKTFEERMKVLVKDVERALEDLNKRHVSLEDRVEAIVDRTSGINDISTKVNLIDEAHITFEDRLEQVERKLEIGRWSKSATPIIQPERIVLPSVSELPLRIDRKHPRQWSSHVILVPSKHQNFAFKEGTLAERRCASRNLNQHLSFEDDSSETFVRCVNTAFAQLFQNRDWMPLYCVNSEDRALSQLQERYLEPHTWDHSFLSDNCIAQLKGIGEAVFIALQRHELSWSEIRALPPAAHNQDESCWEEDLELDGHPLDKTRFSTATTLLSNDGMDMDYKSNAYRSPRGPSTVESLYGSPPPYHPTTPLNYAHGYTSADRAHTGPAVIRPRHPGLDILAGTALGEMPEHPSPRSSISTARTSTDVGYADSTMSDVYRPASSRHVPPSVRSFDMYRDDQHQDKRPRLRTQHSQPNLNSTASSSGSSHHSVPAPTSGPKYVPAGRTKRKATSVSKQKEPVSYHDWKIQMPKLGHKKEREGEAGHQMGQSGFGEGSQATS